MHALVDNFERVRSRKADEFDEKRRREFSTAKLSFDFTLHFVRSKVC